MILFVNISCVVRQVTAFKEKNSKAEHILDPFKLENASLESDSVRTDRTQLLVQV